MAKKGQGLKALKVAHFSSVSGDTFSDIVLFLTAPVLAVMIENVLALPEKSALIILSLAFMAAVAGKSPLKGFIVGLLGMLLALIGSTLSGNGPRMTFGIDGRRGRETGVRAPLPGRCPRLVCLPLRVIRL